MIEKVGKFYLTQDIKLAEGICEFSEEEYLIAEEFGMKKTFENEKMFNCGEIEFANIKWEKITMGSTNSMIYKIALQQNFSSRRLFKSQQKTILNYVNGEIGKYNEHPFFSHLYIWDRTKGNIILTSSKKYGLYFLNLFFTSSIIAEQSYRVR